MSGMQTILSDRPVIVVDDRERESELYRHLRNRDVMLKVARLEVGDYVISDRIVVERKSMRDFEASIIDGRMFEQARELSSFPLPILIIEPGEAERLSPKAVAGAVASLMSDYRLQVLFLNPEMASLLMERMAKREQGNGERRAGITKRMKVRNSDDARIRIVSGFPGINVKTAEKLLSRFRTLSHFFSATPEELMEVEGIGRKKANEIFKIMSGEYKRGRG